MESKTIMISEEEYNQLKKKEEIADDLVFQLEASLKDLEEGRIEKAQLRLFRYLALFFMIQFIIFCCSFFEPKATKIAFFVSLLIK